MANKKITDLTALTSPAATDVLPIIDQSESSVSDQNKKIAYSDLLGKAPDGSQSAPSIAFLSDTDTGIASAGSNALQIVTGGAARAIFASSGTVTIPGNLTVQGTTTTISSVDVSTKDRNLHLGKVAAVNVTGNIAAGAATITGLSSTDNLAPDVVVSLSSGGGNVTLGSGVKVLTVDSSSQVTLDTNFGGTGTADGATLAAGGPTNTTANTGGLILEAGSDTDKTFEWLSASSAWTSSEHLTLKATKELRLADTDSSHYVGFKSPGTVSTSIVWTLPSADGNANEILKTNGSGVLSWVADTATDTTKVAKTGDTMTGDLLIDNQKDLRFGEPDSAGSEYVGFQAPDTIASSVVWKLPNADGSAGQCLKTDASGNLGWVTTSSAAADLTGSTLASGVTASSLTSVGTLTGLTVSGNILMSGTGCIDVPAGTTAERPGSANTGMFRYNSTTGKFEGYGASGWGEIGGSAATGSADLLDIATSSGTGGGGATFDDNRYRFKLVTKGTSDAVTPANAEVLRVSINGVMQMPNDGTGQGDMTEGYVVSGTDIIFDSAPPSGASYFIINMGTQIAIGNATTATIADESSDTTCFPLFATADTGDLGLKSGSNLTFNSATGVLTATSFAGDGSNLTGIASAVADGAIYLCNQTVGSSVSYTIASTKNGLSAGPITVDGTIVVEGNWTIV